MPEKQPATDEIFTPLSDQEIDRLEAILEDVPGGSFDISMLHGLLSCAAVAPTVIRPSWLYDSIFDPEDSGGLFFKNQESTEKTLRLVMRLQNQIIMELDAGLFEPWFYFENADGDTFIVLQPWCNGFLHAASFDADAWRPLLKERPHLIAPIISGADREETDIPSSPDEETTELSILIEEAIPNIRGFFRRLARKQGL